MTDSWSRMRDAVLKSRDEADALRAENEQLRYDVEALEVEVQRLLKREQTLLNEVGEIADTAQAAIRDRDLLHAAIRQHRHTVQSGEEPWATADERLWACLNHHEEDTER